MFSKLSNKSSALTSIARNFNKPKYLFQGQPLHLQRNFSWFTPKPTTETENENNGPEKKYSYDIGLSKFLKNVYMTTSLGVVGSLGAAELACLLELPALPLLGIGIVGTIASCFGLNYSKSVQLERVEHGQVVRFCKDSFGRKLAFASLSLSMGLTITPLVSLYGVGILHSATMTSMAILGTSTAFAFWKPHLAISVGPMLLTGLVGLLALQLSGFVGMCFGAHSFVSLVHSIDVYGGALLFTGMMAYDTASAVEQYKKNDADHIACAVELYLDFMNLLIRLMEIFAKSKK